MASTSASTPISVSPLIELTVPPKNLKRLDDPHDNSRYAYECQVPVTEAAKLVIGRANPRKQDLKKKLAVDIGESLSVTPDIFHLKNRGLWVAASKAEYDNQTQTLSLWCPQGPQEKRYGIVDGGHTKAIIDEYLASLAADGSTKFENGVPKLEPMPYVAVHIKVGVEDSLEDMAVCLNRSSQLKEYALADFQGEFDDLKALLDKESFGKDIGYTENEQTDYDVLDVIQRLTLFCVGVYPNSGEGSHPVVAYASKAKCLEQFLAHKKKFLALAPIIAECFRLPDQVEVLLPAASGSNKFGGFNFARTRPKGSASKPAASLRGLPTNGVVKAWGAEYKVSEAIIYPVAAALRVLIRTKKDGTVVGWREDPVKFFQAHGHKLFGIVRQFYDDAGKSLTAVGKNSEFWGKLHHAAYVAAFPPED
jgi:hypothetical protein